MIYLASPYSDPDPLVREARYKAVCLKAGELMSRGYNVFSPIAHCHGITLFCDLPTGFEYWKEYDREMIAQCNILMVFMLPGWWESVGVQGEIEIAKQLRIDIIYVAPVDSDIDTKKPQTTRRKGGRHDRQS